MLPSPIYYLAVGDVIDLHAEIMRVAGTQAMLLDRAKLESAVHRPRNAAFYEDANLFQQAAVLLAGIALAHAFSDGRLILGLGAGWYDSETRAFGYPVDHRVSRFAEAIQIIHGLLHNGKIDFHGAYYTAREIELRPRGPRVDGPPLLIGATGPRMLELAARYADLWNAGWLSRAEEVAPLSAAVDQACASIGRDPATLQRTAGILVDVPVDQPSQAWMRAWRASEGTISGPPEVVTEAIRDFARQGITHVQIALEPNTLAAIEAFAPVIELLDAG